MHVLNKYADACYPYLNPGGPLHATQKMQMLSYLSMANTWLLPTAHALLFGVVKDLIRAVLGDYSAPKRPAGAGDQRRRLDAGGASAAASRQPRATEPGSSSFDWHAALDGASSAGSDGDDVIDDGLPVRFRVAEFRERSELSGQRVARDGTR